jgi:hypothetical protein
MASSQEQQVAETTPAPADNAAPGEASLLVSEFPPPPYYYRSAAVVEGLLPPPPIPDDALARGTRRAAAAAARARLDAERIRLGQEATDSVFGTKKTDDEENEEEGDVVAVFGEVVEDPKLLEPLDYCEDPTIVKAEVKRLNHSVLQGFVNLVQDLVHRPLENKYDIVSVNDEIFLGEQDAK